MKRITVEVPEGYEVVVRSSSTSNPNDNPTLAQEHRVYPESKSTSSLGTTTNVSSLNDWTTVSRPYSLYACDHCDYLWRRKSRNQPIPTCPHHSNSPLKPYNPDKSKS